jgi:hypothetical protein
MKGIKYKNDGEIIELVNDIDLYHFDKNANRNEPDLVFNNSLFIACNLTYNPEHHVSNHTKT